MDHKISLTYKLCPKCRVLKTTADFQRNALRKDGMQIYCRPCFNAISKARRKAFVPDADLEKQCTECGLTLQANSFRAMRTECKECEGSKRLRRYAERSTVWQRPEGTKKCVSCCGDMSTELFKREPGTPDGLSYTCLACLKAYRAGYHARNREKENASNRLRARTNRESLLSTQRAYYWSNRKKILDQASARHAAHPEFSRIRTGRRRAILRGAILGDQQAVAAFYAHVKNAEELRCNWCGEFAEKGNRHVDHIVPLAKGGSHSTDNLCCSCAPCNRSKGAKLMDEFMRVRA